MSPITWRNVSGKNDAAANSLVANGLDTIGDSFGELKSALKGIQSDRKAEYDHTLDTNTQNFLNEVSSRTDLDQLQADQDSGYFDRMLASFGGDVDSNQARNAVANQITALQGRKTSEINFNNRMAQEAEKPFLSKFDKLLVTDKKAAGDYLKANEGNFINPAAQYRKLEQEGINDKEAEYQAGRTNYLRNRVLETSQLIGEGKRDSVRYGEEIRSILADEGVTFNDYVNGNVNADKFDQIKGRIDKVKKPINLDEVIKRRRQLTTDSPYAQAEDIGDMDAFIREQYDYSLNTSDKEQINSQVDNYARVNGFETLANNPFSTENQERFGGVNGMRKVSEALDQAFDEEELKDADYSIWKSDLIEMATSGIEISTGPSGETTRVKVPVEVLSGFVKATKGEWFESDSDFRDSLTDYLSTIGASSLREQALRIEAERSRLTLAKENEKFHYDPHWRARSMDAILNRATPRFEPEPEDTNTPEPVEVVTDISQYSKADQEFIERVRAKFALKNNLVTGQRARKEAEAELKSRGLPVNLLEEPEPEKRTYSKRSRT